VSDLLEPDRVVDVTRRDCIIEEDEEDADRSRDDVEFVRFRKFSALIAAAAVVVGVEVVVVVALLLSPPPPPPARTTNDVHTRLVNLGRRGSVEPHSEFDISFKILETRSTFPFLAADTK
jgi:hypothetical protein